MIVFSICRIKYFGQVEEFLIPIMKVNSETKAYNTIHFRKATSEKKTAQNRYTELLFARVGTGLRSA